MLCEISNICIIWSCEQYLVFLQCWSSPLPLWLTWKSHRFHFSYMKLCIHTWIIIDMDSYLQQTEHCEHNRILTVVLPHTLISVLSQTSVHMPPTFIILQYNKLWLVSSLYTWNASLDTLCYAKCWLRLPHGNNMTVGAEILNHAWLIFVNTSGQVIVNVVFTLLS